MRHFSGMTRRLAGLASQQTGPALCSCSITTSAATAELPQSAAASDVPAGHEKSDLRPSISNISLNRRRDISLRNDIKFYSGKDEPLSLRELLRAKSHAEVISVCSRTLLTDRCCNLFMAFADPWLTELNLVSRRDLRLSSLGCRTWAKCAPRHMCLATSNRYFSCKAPPNTLACCLWCYV